MKSKRLETLKRFINNACASMYRERGSRLSWMRNRRNERQRRAAQFLPNLKGCTYDLSGLHHRNGLVPWFIIEKMGLKDFNKVRNGTFTLEKASA